MVARSSPKNSSPSCQSPPRPHRSFPATVTSPGSRSLHQHPADEGVGVGLPQQDPDQAGGLLALGPGPRPAACARRGRRAWGRAADRRPAPRTRRARPGSRRATVPEHPDARAGAADRPPLGGHLVDEGDTRRWMWRWAWRARSRPGLPRSLPPARETGPSPRAACNRPWSAIVCRRWTSTSSTKPTPAGGPPPSSSWAPIGWTRTGSGTS